MLPNGPAAHAAERTAKLTRHASANDRSIDNSPRPGTIVDQPERECKGLFAGAGSTLTSANASACSMAACGLMPDQPAIAFRQRTKRAVARDGLHQLVEVPRFRGFGWRLDLEQIHIVREAAVGADRGVPREHVVDRYGPHRGGY